MRCGHPLSSAFQPFNFPIGSADSLNTRPVSGTSRRLQHASTGMTYGYGTKQTAYLEADIMSRPKEWLVPLLYEHLLSNLRRAGVQIEASDVTGRAESLDRASAIVLELSAALDRDNGGPLARDLSALYAYFLTEILQIGVTRSVARLQKLSILVEELLDAWTQAAEQVAPRAAASRSLSISAA